LSSVDIKTKEPSPRLVTCTEFKELESFYDVQWVLTSLECNKSNDRNTDYNPNGINFEKSATRRVCYA